jgi:predicted nucleotidyltransferase
MPQYSIAVMERQFEAGRGPIFPETYEMPIISALRRMTIEQIKLLPYMEQGLENRLKLAAEKAGSYPELLDMIGTRRYTDTRIQRILFSILISLTKERFDYFNSIGGPAYIRILGFSRTGRKLLASIRGTTALPLITKTADHKNSDIPVCGRLLAMEAAATDQYVLGCQDPHVRKSEATILVMSCSNDTANKPAP